MVDQPSISLHSPKIPGLRGLYPMTVTVDTNIGHLVSDFLDRSFMAVVPLHEHVLGLTQFENLFLQLLVDLFKCVNTLDACVVHFA